MSGIPGILWLFVFVYAVPFIVGPVLIWFTQHIAQSALWEETQGDQLTPEMQEYLGRIIREFGTEGFDTVANMHVPNGVKNVQGFQVLLVNRGTSDLATIIMSRATATLSMLFSVTSKFGDGQELITGANPGVTGVFPSKPSKHWQNFSWVTKPAELCEAHRRRLKAAGWQDRPRLAPAPGQERAYFDSEWTNSNEWHVQCGYRYHDENRQVLHFTVKGACLATWKMVQPVKAIRMWLRDRKARNVWNSLGMNTRGAIDPSTASR